MLIACTPLAASTSPSAPIDLTFHIQETPALNQPFRASLDIVVHIDVGNVTVDLAIPPGWSKSPAHNRTVDLRRGETRTFAWDVTPKSEGFWILRAGLETQGGGMTSWTQQYGFLHAKESRFSGNPEEVIPTPAVDIQFRAVEKTPANVTLIVTATPQESWLKFGNLSTDFGILNESRHAEGPGSRALTATLTAGVPPYHGARAWAQFGFTPDWRTDNPPGTGRPGTGLGCRDLWVNRAAEPTLEIEPSRDCNDMGRRFAPGPGIAALGLLGFAAVWIRRRRLD